jgi:lysyl-tRNA synthetase class 2
VIDAAGLRARARVLAALRRTLEARGYLEVPTAVLVPSGAMEEHLHVVPAANGCLRTSPEFALKRAWAAGLGRIYEIGPCLRDREWGEWHGREFTMLEWYRAGAEPGDVVDEVDRVVGAAAEALGRPRPEFRTVTWRDAFREATGVDAATATAEEISPEDAGWQDAVERRWVADVARSLTGAVFVTDWPAPAAALARVHDGPWPVARRFEAFVDGIELANGFFELQDAAVLRGRFASSAAGRLARGDVPHPVDAGVLDATSRLPRGTGVALGVDRLVAALCGWTGIAPGRVDAWS